jgi:hypothetical protein
MYLKIYGENRSSKMKWADICPALMGLEHGFIWLHNALSLNARYCNGINLDGTVSLHFFLDEMYHIEVVRCLLFLLHVKPFFMLILCLEFQL